MADTNQILRLAAIIREVDGNHSKGAAALAESILDHPGFRAALSDEPAVPEGKKPTRDELWELWLRLNNELPDRPAAVAEFWEHAQIDARARAALAKADGPAVPEGREPASVTGQPSDQELLDIAASTIEPYECSGITTDEYEPETECAVEAYGSELIAFARAVLAHWGNPAPAPPADGEVAELAAWLRSTGEGQPCLSDEGYARLTRAAELLERLIPPQPVPVSERLPGPSVKVLAHYFNGLGKGRTICAIWVPAKTRSDSYGDDDFTEYDEESDTFYWPEGWYETIENWDDLGYVKVDEGEVIYWQPIPEWPAHALPLPEVGE